MALFSEGPRGEAALQVDSQDTTVSQLRERYRRRGTSSSLERAEKFLSKLAAARGEGARDSSQPGAPAGSATPTDDPGADVEIDLPAKGTGWEWTEAVNRSAVLPREEQTQCARAIESGVLARAALERAFLRPDGASDAELEAVALLGQEARERMIVGNLRLVLYWARAQAKGDLELMQDLFQEGCFGLVRAIEGWDYQRGYSFSTYATWHIRQTMFRAVANQTLVIRIPVHVHDEWAANRRSSQALSKNAEYAAQLIKGLMPWDQVTDDAGLPNSYTAARVQIRDPYEEVERKATLASLMRGLDAKAVDILGRRNGLLGELQTLDEIGECYGVTRERIRQLESAATAQIRLRVLQWALESDFVAVKDMAATGAVSEEIINHVLSGKPWTLKSLATSVGTNQTKAGALLADTARALLDVAL